MPVRSRGSCEHEENYRIEVAQSVISTDKCKEESTIKQTTAILSLLLLAVLPMNAQGVQVSKNEAADLVLHEVLPGVIGTVDVFISKSPVLATTGLRLPRRSIACPYRSNWVVFIDDHVHANWAHPCRYVFVNTERREYRIVNDVIFPARAEDFEMVSGVPVRPVSLPLKTDGNPRTSLQTAVPNPHCYAVLINGGWDTAHNAIRYWNDISAMFCALTQVYGYMPENIYVHSTDGIPANNFGYLDLDRIEPPYTDDIDLPAYKPLIANTFSTLASTIGPDDQLFVYVTDHGDRDDHGSFIYLWDGNVITTSDLRNMLAPINAAEMIIVMEQCNSGGFVTDPVNITGPHRLIHTACAATELSNAEHWITSDTYDEFVFYWTAAARGYYPYYNQPWNPWWQVGHFLWQPFFSNHPPDYNPDTSGDGLVQMEEPFSYANNFDSNSPIGFYQSSGPVENPISYNNAGFQEDLLCLSG